MDSYIEELLEDNGWIIECYSPLEISHQDGSRATLTAAQIIMNAIVNGYSDE